MQINLILILSHEHTYDDINTGNNTSLYLSNLMTCNPQAIASRNIQIQLWRTIPRESPFTDKDTLKYGKDTSNELHTSLRELSGCYLVPTNSTERDLKNT